MGTVRRRHWSLVALFAIALLVFSGLTAPAEAATRRSLSIAVKPTTAYSGTSVTFSGRLTRSPKGTVVHVQRKSGKKWVAVRNLRTTSSAGNYSGGVPMPMTGGTFSFRAVATKTKKLRTATSRTVKIVVMRRVAATIKATPSLIQLGSPMTLSGTIAPFVAGKVAFIQRFNGATWTDVTTAIISKKGTYARTFSPIATTVYRVYVPKVGYNAAAYSASTKLTISNGPIPPDITTTSLPTGQTGVAYSQALAKTGRPGTWAVTSGSLPSGLTLKTLGDSSGLISGTPTTAGTSTFSVTFSETDTALSDTQPLSIKIYAPPSISTASLPDAVQNSPYSQQLAVSGGSGAGSWTVSAGTLPTGLSLSSSGLLAGTPTTLGSSNFTIRFTDAVGSLPLATKAFSIGVFDGPVITTTSLPFAIKGQAYSQQLTKAGGSGSGTWSLASGTLPAGVTLSGAGLLSGTPTAEANAAITVRFTDANAGLAPATKALTLRVYAQPAVSTTTLPSAAVGKAYSQQLTATGGSGSGTWAVSGGTLPAGVSLSAAGLLSGTPTATGSAAFTVTYTDAVGGLAVASKALSLDVFDDPSITTTSLPIGIKGQAYSQQLVVSGGSGAGTWSLETGTLPAGLSLSAAGLVSGTPSANVDSTFTVKFTDAASNLATDTQGLEIVVYTQTSITTSSLAAGVVGSAYSQQLVAAGGSGSGTWTVDSPALPAGLTLSAAGLISGTPTTAGSTGFTVRYIDAVAGLASPTKPLSITVYSQPVITSSGLPDILRGSTTSYNVQLTKSGGSGSGTWSIQSGSLPPASSGFSGITLSPSGKLAGTSNTDGDYPFTVLFTDSVTGSTTTKALTLHVGPVAILTATIPDAKVGTAYSLTMDGSPNNLVPSGWSISAGSLPSGLSLSGAGVLSGTPTVSGDFTFTVSYTVLLKGTRNRAYTIHVSPAG